MSEKGASARAIVMRLAISRFYQRPNNGAGGNLHIVLDDNNLEDEHVKFCLDRANQEGDREGAAIATELLTMSIDERRFATGTDQDIDEALTFEGPPDGECAWCERSAVRWIKLRPACSVHAENPPEVSNV